MEEIKSITTKGVFGTPDKEKDINKPLIYVTGIVDNHFVHESKYGENIGLKGSFIAVNAKTGEQFSAKAAFLPAQVQGPILERLKVGDIEIEFQACIMIAPSDVSPSGYAWIAEAPQTEERKAKDARLMDIVQGFPLQLEDKTKAKK